MAKALVGALSHRTDLHVLDEIARLRVRVRDLETEVGRLRRSNEALLDAALSGATVSDAELERLHRAETALA